MHRRMTITVKNNTNSDWELYEDDLAHGKWMSGSPATEILANSDDVQIKSEKQTGVSYGTTGYVKYENSDIGCILEIEWNKPYGSDATTCDASVTGNGYKATVENKDFQRSYASCDVVIEAI